jgi:hypothetical protein
LNSTTQYNTPQSTVFLSTAFTGPLSATRIQDVPASVFATVDRIEKQSSFNATDVAIIHVNGMNDTPMVQLGDSSGVQTQDQLSIIGFPGAADVSQTATNLLTSSVNIVNVSSIKTSDSGAPLIQVGGTVEPGDSGGPALDASGTVVGIVSFALTSTGGTSFLQASNSARTLVQQLGLDTTPGPFQKAWSQAFNDYGSTNAGHWHKAAQEFQQLANNYPQFKGIMPYLQYAQQQAATEKQPVTQPVTQTNSSKSFLTSYWPILAAGAVIVLGLLLFGVVINQRRGAKPVLATSSQRYEASSNGNGAMANPFAPNPTGNRGLRMSNLSARISWYPGPAAI